VLLLWLTFSDAVRNRLELNEATKPDNIVEVDSGVSQNQQMASLLDTSSSGKSPTEEFSEGQRVARGVDRIVRNPSTRNILAVVRNQLATPIAERPQFQSPLRHEIELIPLLKQSLVASTCVNGPMQNGLVIRVPKLAFDIPHRPILRRVIAAKARRRPRGGNPQQGRAAQHF
jgi:hypothetical protein